MEMTSGLFWYWYGYSQFWPDFWKCFQRPSKFDNCRIPLIPRGAAQNSGGAYFNAERPQAMVRTRAFCRFALESDRGSVFGESTISKHRSRIREPGCENPKTPANKVSQADFKTPFCTNNSHKKLLNSFWPSLSIGHRSGVLQQPTGEKR